MADLRGKTALVTGASRGIGRATATALAKAGARLIVHYGRSEEQALSLVREIKAGGGGAAAVSVDLEANDGAHRLAAAVIPLVGSRLDILVSNAGTLCKSTLETQTMEAFDRQMAVNTRAPFFLIQQLLPVLRPGSSVILVSSVSAKRFVGYSAYAASKGAIDAMVISLAAELGARDIRVNAVAPGGIETDLAADLKDPAIREAAMARQALRRIGQPDDIASAIVFLASDEARWVTGETVQVGGGSGLSL